MNERRIPAEAVRALLGPEGPELTCEQCFELLDVYVEAELGDRDAERAVPGMHAHLVGCPACGEDHAALRDLVAAEQTQQGEMGE